MSKLKISIITVCYNAVDKIEETIQSVINQTYLDLEYIIIDGASNDGTMDVINKYRGNISLIVSESDKGIFDAMNKGIDLCTGNYCLFLNCGDYFFSKDSVKDAVAQFDQRSDVIYGNTEYRFDYGNEVLAPQSLEKVMTGAFCCHQSTFFSTNVIKKYKYDLSYKIVSDWVLFRNMYMEHRKFQYIDITIASYDNIEGLSTANNISSFIQHQKEKARCMKIDDDFCWRCLLLYKSLCFITRRFLIRFIPESIYGKLKRYWIHIHIQG